MSSSLGQSACPWCARSARIFREVRGNLPGRKIARLIFRVEEGLMDLLHAFIKKIQKTPQKDIDLALKRKKGEER
jgi:phage-related protein